MPIIDPKSVVGKLATGVKPNARNTAAKSKAGAQARGFGGRVSHDGSKASGVKAAPSSKTPSKSVITVPQGTRKGRGPGSSWNSPSSHDFSRRFSR